MSNTLVVPSQDVTVQNLTSFHVSMFHYDDSVLSLARDYIKGRTEDYYFFQYDQDEYVLILSDDMSTPHNTDCSASECQIIYFWRVDSLVTGSESISINGTISEVGASPSVDDVLLSGDVSTSAISSDYQVGFMYADSLHIYNSEYVCYSSVSSITGKLVEGVSYYAYAGIALAVGIIAFRLADRFFRRIY